MSVYIIWDINTLRLKSYNANRFNNLYVNYNCVCDSVVWELCA